jgi:hypothetical protein
VTASSFELQGAARMWTAEELDGIGQAEELRLAPRRTDGTLRSFTTMWVVCANGELYVRSAGGPQRPWFRYSQATGRGQIRAGGSEVDVRFVEVAPDAQSAIDAAYHEKYDRYGPSIVGHVTGPDVRPVTIRLVPDHEEGNAT